MSDEPTLVLIAKALRNSEPGMEVKSHLYWMPSARAAVDALREPPLSVLQTACSKHQPGVPMGPGHGECPRIANRRVAWRKSIDAILAEGDERIET